MVSLVIHSCGHLNRVSSPADMARLGYQCGVCANIGVSGSGSLIRKRWKVGND